MKFKIGIGGNYYFYSPNKKEIEEVCEKINKSKNSIYYNKKYSVWAIRIKSKLHKNKVKEK